MQTGDLAVAIVQDIAASIGWTIFAVILFYGGVRLFDFLDPIDFQAEIRQGNVAAGVLLAAIVISLSAIIIAVVVS
ncbi:MAG: DUF350 domain-containing protein [Cyanobacteria bacterium P01_F01_bin.33]